MIGLSLKQRAEIAKQPPRNPGAVQLVWVSTLAEDKCYAKHCARTVFKPALVPGSPL